MYQLHVDLHQQTTASDAGNSPIVAPTAQQQRHKSG